MTKWEYLILSNPVHLHGVGALDELGEEGWELAGFDGRGTAFLKRPKPESVKPKAAAKK